MMFNHRTTEKRLTALLDALREGKPYTVEYDESLASALECHLLDIWRAQELQNARLTEEKNRSATLIADIAHQCKTPLANLQLYSELLSESNLSSDAHAHVEALLSQTEKLTFLLEALLKGAQLEAGILQTKPERAPLAPLLKGAIKLMQPAAHAKSMTIQVNASEGYAVYDLKWTSEALQNVLDNAIKYSPAGSCIQISVVPLTFYTRIDVIDQGPGVSEKDSAKIFKRFYRSPAVHQLPGVGLGLYLTREILKSQKGYITVKSAQGACFSLYLPTSKESV